MSSDRPWAPFPVQDWSTMPYDPLLPVPAVPNPRRRRWWPPLAILVVLALLLGSVAYLGSRDVADRPTAAGEFLPANGSAAYERVEKTRELKTDTSVQVTESARLNGLTAVLSGDTAFGVRVFANLYGEGADLRIWRTTSTTIDPGPTSQTPGKPAGQSTGQSTVYYRVRDAVELIGQSGPDGALVFQPGLVELPADAHADQSWNSAGSAGDVWDYQADLRSTAGAGGCLDVSGEVRLLTKAGAQQEVITVQRTWCPGQGLTAAVESSGSTATRTTQVSAPPSPAVATTDAPVTWTDPAAWTEHPQETVSVDPTFGEMTMNGTPASVAPVRTRSGTVIRALASLDDLVALTPQSGSKWVSVWRTHVSGTILTLAAFGDVIIATTSDRTVVAYTATGVRLWQLGLDELAPTRPVRVSDTEAALVALNGEVRVFTITTGSVRWQQDIGSDVNVTPAAGSGVVVVADRGGTVSALDAATGKTRWTVELEGKAAAFAGDVLVVVQDQTAHAIDARSGRRLWLRPYLGIFRQLAVFGDRFVLASDSATVSIDTAGAVVGRFGGSVALTVTGTHLVRWGTTEATVVDPQSAEVARWTLPPTTVSMVDRPAVALDDRAVLLGPAWAFRSWSAGAP